ncbi:GNAT family N-acetyltransferase [Dysgonomonas sp. GY75]|nr:GNAT family N-acetyltransferase [Dysgonomonas sp. GY75]
MMEISEIREFTQDGFKAVQKLAGTLISSGTIHLTESYYRELLASANSHLFFIADDGNIAGMLTVGIYKSPTGTKAWIEDVVVDGSYRGQGLGRLLVEHAIAFSKSLGADSLMLTSNPSRIAANKLYQSLNFTQKETNVYRMTFE